MSTVAGFAQHHHACVADPVQQRVQVAQTGQRRRQRRHILRNALLPVVTLAGIQAGGMIGGAVLTETVFAWPGIGQYAYRSAVTLDLPAIMGVSLFVAVVYITINFVVDVLYGLIDPRIRVT